MTTTHAPAAPDPPSGATGPHDQRAVAAQLVTDPGPAADTAPVRVIGIDLSLTSTGVAIIADDGITVTRVTSKPPTTPRHPRTGKPTPPTLHQRRQRLIIIVHEIHQLVCAGNPHLVVIEQPAYSKNAGSTHDRSGLWWLVVNEISLSGYQVVEVTPSARAKYATGKGNAGKDDVLAAVVRRYPHVETRGNDEADALVLAAMGARHLGAPIDDLPLTHVVAMSGVRWPGAS